MEGENIFCMDSPLGTLVIHSDLFFVTAIDFAEEKVNDRQPETDVENQCYVQLHEYFTGKLQEFTVPVKQEGTEFQQRVWNEVMNIPFGKTISYQQLANRLGDPKSIRAAGTANGKNRIPILVPCHRVIGSDGSLTGYAWGLDKKEWLLRHENSLPGQGQTSLFDEEN